MCYGWIDVVVNNIGYLLKGELLVIIDDNWYVGFDLILLNVVCVMCCVMLIF